VRYGIAAVLAGAAVAAAVALASLKLNPHGHSFAIINYGGVTGSSGPAFQGHLWTPARASWQIPVAIATLVLGFGAAIGVAFRRGSDHPAAPV